MRISQPTTIAARRQCGSSTQRWQRCCTSALTCLGTTAFYSTRIRTHNDTDDRRAATASAMATTTDGSGERTNRAAASHCAARPSALRRVCVRTILASRLTMLTGCAVCVCGCDCLDVRMGGERRPTKRKGKRRVWLTGEGKQTKTKRKTKPTGRIRGAPPTSAAEATTSGRRSEQHRR